MTEQHSKPENDVSLLGVLIGLTIGNFGWAQFVTHDFPRAIDAVSISALALSAVWFCRKLKFGLKR